MGILDRLQGKEDGETGPKTVKADPNAEPTSQRGKNMFRLARCVLYSTLMLKIKQVPQWISLMATAFLWLRIWFGPGFDPTWPPPRSYTKPRVSPKEEKAWKLKGHESMTIDRLRSTGDKMPVFVQRFVPECGLEKAKGVVAWVPPLNSYAGFHMDEIVRIRDAGYVVCTIDLEGTGRSAGHHGYFFGYDDLAFDVVDFCIWCRQTAPGLPLLVVGSSWGATLAGMAVLELNRPPAAVVLRNTFVQPSKRHFKGGGLLGFILGGWAPLLPIRKPLGVHELPAEVRKAAVKDPMYYSGRLQIGTSMAIARGISKFIEIVEEMEDDAAPFPLLVQHARDDPVVPFTVAENLAANFKAERKTLKKYAAEGHHLCFEAPEVVARADRDMIEWLDGAVKDYGRKKKKEEEEEEEEANEGGGKREKKAGGK